MKPESENSINLWAELDKLFAEYNLKKWRQELDGLTNSSESNRELARESRTLFDLYRMNQKQEHRRKAFGYAMLHSIASLQNKQMAPVISCVQDLQFINAPTDLIEEIESRMTTTFSGRSEKSLHLKEITNEILPPISDLHIFSGLQTNELRSIIKICHKKDFQPDEIIFRESNPPDYFYIIIEGSVRIFNQFELDEILTSGGFFGEMALLTDQKRQATAQAIGSLKCLQLSRLNLDDLFKSSPTLKSRVMECFYLRSFLIQVSKSHAFKSFSDSDLIDFFYCFKSSVIEAGETIFEEATTSDSLFFILSGEVLIQNSSRTLNKTPRSGFFGEMGFISGEKRSAKAKASQRSHLLQLESYFLSELQTRYPKIFEILQKVAIGRELINKGLLKPIQS